MDIQLADVTIHIDEKLDQRQREAVEEELRSLHSVVSVRNADRTPHLAMVKYNPTNLDAARLLEVVKAQGVHAEIIGL